MAPSPSTQLAFSTYEAVHRQDRPYSFPSAFNCGIVRTPTSCCAPGGQQEGQHYDMIILIYKMGLKSSPTVLKADQGHQVYRTKVGLAAFNGHPKDLPPAGLNCRSDSIKHISPAFSFHARGDVWSCHPSNSQPVEGIKHESLHCLYIPWSTFHRV